MTPKLTDYQEIVLQMTFLLLFILTGTLVIVTYIPYFVCKFCMGLSKYLFETIKSLNP